jgi:hypothetical protein
MAIIKPSHEMGNDMESYGYYTVSASDCISGNISYLIVPQRSQYVDINVAKFI